MTEERNPDHENSENKSSHPAIQAEMISIDEKQIDKLLEWLERHELAIYASTKETDSNKHGSKTGRTAKAAREALKKLLKERDEAAEKNLEFFKLSRSKGSHYY